MKESAKENEEINKTVKELNKISQDPEEVARYEEREWSIMRYNVEMKANMEIGEKRGREEGRKEKEAEIIQELNSRNMSLKQIAEIVKLKEEEVKKILNERN